MTAPRSIIIVGGGLAGLTLGIGLRKKGVPVTVFEAGTYPRHRVCGEFISGRGQQVLGRLGLSDLFINAGAIPARSASFFFANAKSPVRPLAPPALCLSRFKMDALLAEKFKELGGELRAGERAPLFDSDEPVVRATGRRPKPLENKWRWFGLKIHARNLSMETDLEMHLTENGYVGLCRLADGMVNVCGLFRSRPGSETASGQRTALLSGTPGTLLHQRFKNASFEEGSFCSVAGLPLRPTRARDLGDCSIGDALTMIPPVTGNGMSMAFESAEIAIPVLTAYHRGEITWRTVRENLAKAFDAAFGRRLAWARFLQWTMFAPAFRGGLSTMALHAGWFWRLMFVRTR